MSFESGADAARRSPRVLWVVIVVALVAWIVAALADRRDRVNHLSVRCDARGCSATIDGGNPLLVASRGPGRAAGLYAYSSWERGVDQAFRNFSLRKPHNAAFRHALLDDGNAPRQLTERGWKLRPGVGFAPPAAPGKRSVALLATQGGEAFSLDVELVAAEDAGIVFDAAGPADGRVFVIRPRFNDAFFFDLEGGEPGAVLALMPLRPLTVGRELLRLVGLAAEILLVAVSFIAVVRWLVMSIGRGSAPVGFRRNRPPAWCATTLAVATFAALAAVAWFGLTTVPHIPDETAYLFQAKIFAGGALWAPPPAAPEFFAHEHVVVTEDRWFGKYPPLFPALLSLGVLAGAPWLVNPLLGALTALVIYRITLMLSDWRWAIVAWMLTLTSPFFLIMGGTMMSHMTCALFVSLFVWMLLAAVGKRSLGHAAIAGVCLGLALFARPYTAFLTTCAAGVYGVTHWARASDRRAVATIFVVLALGTTPFLVGFLAWNGIYSESSSLALELHTTYDPGDRLGFGPDRGAGWLKTWGSWGHTPAKALRSTHRFLDHTSEHLLGWPWRLSFALVLAPFLWGRAHPATRLLAGVFGALVVGHAPYWATQHIGYGARYWFSAVPALMVLGALGLRSLIPPSRVGPLGSACVAAVLGCLVSANLGIYLPRKLRELPNYGDVSAALMRTVRERNLGDAVVFVHTEGLLYNDGFFLNDPFLEEGPVFVRDLGPRNREFMTRYPNFLAYRWKRGRLTPLGGERPDGDEVLPAVRER